MTDREALALTARLTRAGFALSILLSLGLAAVVWPLITGVLGPAYRGAIVPSVVLLGANVLWGGQWLTSRALAARGNPSVLMWSYAFNLVTMVAVDTAIVPSLGALGAAIGSVVAASVGLGVSLRAYHKEGLALTEFIPRPTDLELLVGRLRPMLRSLHA
jgi:O-antigen/teichoic acid export membrane protein